MIKLKYVIPLSFGLLLLVTAGFLLAQPSLRSHALQPQPFDGQQAWQDVAYQVSLGPRIPGSDAHAKTVDWMVSDLKAAGWDVEIQDTSLLDKPIRNVIARWGKGNPWVIVGAHYDSRILADHDPNVQNRTQAVPGANDGASGVAVLLELARILPAHLKQNPGRLQQVWLVFFDAEDNGEIPGWDWILGSRAFVNSLKSYPDAAVILDMIGDADLNIYKERNSDTKISGEIWLQAASLGYGKQFIPQYKYGMLDDHTPFLEAGIPAADLIDFDYPYYHTIEDTADKVSSNSLKIVGDTMLTWLTQAPAK